MRIVHIFDRRVNCFISLYHNQNSERKTLGRKTSLNPPMMFSCFFGHATQSPELACACGTYEIASQFLRSYNVKISDFVRCAPRRTLTAGSRKPSGKTDLRELEVLASWRKTKNTLKGIFVFVPPGGLEPPTSSLTPHQSALGGWYGARRELRHLPRIKFAH